MTADNTYKSKELVPGSGVYIAEHIAAHAKPHEVTLLYGASFPVCRVCGAITYQSVKLAHSPTYYEYFATD